LSCHSQASLKKVFPSHNYFKALSEAEKQKYIDTISELYQKLLLSKGFNGEILVTKNDEVLLKDYHGFYNFKTKSLIDSNSVFQLASISKTFTGMAVLHLWEQGKIGLNDDVRKYFPAFPYNNITIQSLLCHKSGLPNYANFMEPYTTQVIVKRNKQGKIIKRIYQRIKINGAAEIKGFVTNEQMLQYMIEHKPALVMRPNTGFNYCNTNFSILALVIEKITGIAYPQYMKDSVFTPLGMKHTFVFSEKDTANYIPSYSVTKPFKLEKYDCIYGDKNIYSNVDDLLLWDKALYAGTFIKPSTYQMAIQVYSKVPHKENRFYGLGWHLFSENNGDIIPYHNGWWHGNNNVFIRVINSRATIIVLGNKFNKANYDAMKMAGVFVQDASIDTDEENINSDSNSDSTNIIGH
jgi:CubicO group peptidase (beta-lactamase class C family)